MVLNVVLHRLNIDHVEEILEMADRMGADYVELANTQYYGWAWHNREQLMPSREQLSAPRQVTEGDSANASATDADLLRGARLLRASPEGLHERLGLDLSDHRPRRHRAALPCGAYAARARVSRTCATWSIERIWYDSAGFNHFRGDAWMKEPCRSCPERTKDFGGCRCQAYLLTGDAANADPVCDLSPHHHRVTEAVARAERPAADAREEKPLVFRSERNSSTLFVKQERT